MRSALPDFEPAATPANDAKPVVFVLPGLSGDLRELATLLSPAEADVRLIPIPYRHWSDLQPEPDEFDRLVEDCVSQIETHNPPHTILLIGYSFGGSLAWAVAQALEALGHRIGLLGLIDSPACPDIEESAETVSGRMGRVMRGIRRGETWRQLARSSAGVVFRANTGTQATFRRLHGSGLLRRIFDCIDLNIQVRYHVILLQECVERLESLASRIDYPAVLFRCPGARFGEDPALGWTRYLSNVRVVMLPGDHDSVMQARNVDQIIAPFVGNMTEGEEIMARTTESTVRESDRLFVVKGSP